MRTCRIFMIEILIFTPAWRLARSCFVRWSIYNAVVRHAVTRRLAVPPCGNSSCVVRQLRCKWANQASTCGRAVATSHRRSVRTAASQRTTGGRLLQKPLTKCTRRLRLLTDLIDWFRRSDRHASWPQLVVPIVGLRRNKMVAVWL